MKPPSTLIPPPPPPPTHTQMKSNVDQSCTVSIWRNYLVIFWFLFKLVLRHISVCVLIKLGISIRTKFCEMWNIPAAPRGKCLKLVGMVAWLPGFQELSRPSPYIYAVYLLHRRQIVFVSLTIIHRKLGITKASPCLFQPSNVNLRHYLASAYSELVPCAIPRVAFCRGAACHVLLCFLHVGFLRRQLPEHMVMKA